MCVSTGIIKTLGDTCGHTPMSTPSSRRTIHRKYSSNRLQELSFDGSGKI